MSVKTGCVGRVVWSRALGWSAGWSACLRSLGSTDRKIDSGGKGDGSCGEDGGGTGGGKVEDIGDAIRRRSASGFGIASITAGVVVAGTMCLEGTARADLVAAWGFNGLEETAVWLPSDEGKAWLDLGTIHGSSHLYEGTELNAPTGWQAGDALGFQGPAVESGSFLLGIESGLAVPGGADPLSISFAARRSSTGFDRVLVES